jgi:trans-2,3-dihydro-3-hydroxyanthranilate isomerase
MGPGHVLTTPGAGANRGRVDLSAGSATESGPAAGSVAGMSTALPYEIVDVFTDRPYAGNPLAVVFDADGLSGEQLQAIAREFNLSETVFVLPPTAPDATYRARIFTPSAELPFAGHPSVGVAATQLRRGLFPAGEVVQECGAGLLPIQVYEDGHATLTGGAPTVGPELDPGPLLAVAGLSDVDFAGPAPRVAGCGLEFLFLAVHAESVAKAELDVTAARTHGVRQVSVFAWDAATSTAHARVFVPGVGVPEDPATGSAALGLGVWLVTSGLLPADAESPYTVRQGGEIQRPSTLDCVVTARRGQVVSATVTGQVAPVARGEILVPPVQ